MAELASTDAPSVRSHIHTQVSRTLTEKPIIGVVRTATSEEARRQATLFADAGLGLVEVTFSVPGATELVRALQAQRGDGGPPWIGMGTVTSEERAHQAVAAGAEFLVSPNAFPELVEVARQAGRFVVVGALTPTEIVQAHLWGADLVKVYPLPTVGGASYLATVRQPLSDIPMLAAGGFSVEEIPAYRAAGASAFGMASPLVGQDEGDTHRRIRRALALARGLPGEAPE